jgi:thiamine kinase-like enzyme
MRLMDTPGAQAGGTIASSDLKAALETSLSRASSLHGRIARIDRVPSPYQSSFPIEELTVLFDDGRSLELILKNLSLNSLTPELKRAKPTFLYDPEREIKVYSELLAEAGLGTAKWHAHVLNPERDRFWILLERVAGQDLSTVGDFDVWKQAARWLAALHANVVIQTKVQQDKTYLVEFDRTYYLRWIERALSYHAGRQPSDKFQQLQFVAEQYATLVDELLQIPTTVIHGEFYAPNVLVHRSGGEESTHVRICPVDWERAALAPAMIDIAALSSGKWDLDQRRELTTVYYESLSKRGVDVSDPSSYERNVELCRLHLAVQWLGWSQEWNPPPTQAQDWLAEALNAVRVLL